MLNQVSNLNLVKQHFESDQCDANSRKYYEGLKYQIPQNKLHRLMRAITTHDSKLQILSQFYPYQQMVQATVHERERENRENKNYSLLISGAIVFSIHNQGRRGKVLGILIIFIHRGIERIREILQHSQNIQTLHPCYDPPLFRNDSVDQPEIHEPCGITMASAC